MRRMFGVLCGLLLIVMVFGIAPDLNAQFYDHSYALVIGIDKYASSQWKNLSYAVNDAQGVARFLEKHRFRVMTLHDEKATRGAIVRQLSILTRKLRKNDRVLVFFAGHGYTETLGDQDFGYIVPYEGTDTSNYISMEQLQEFSRKMGTAKHQLFIMDSCYGGLLGVRSGAIDDSIPNYLAEITSRPARQVLMAGGKDQQVVDNGPEGHSVFTGYLLKALEEGEADLNRDRHITFPEITAYLLPAASNSFQTPSSGTLSGHELGEFVFSLDEATPPSTSHSEPLHPDSRLRGERYRLRSESQRVDDSEAERSFDLVDWKPRKYVENTFERQGQVVIDQTTGLMWQQSGSEVFLRYSELQEFVQELNRGRFAGYDDWRLPTIPELMSLLEPDKQINDLYIDPVFDSKQSYAWSADNRSTESVWFVDFNDGLVSWSNVYTLSGFRAVRSGHTP